ncbi:cupin domain-containing protein [Epibacterium ulvae]|uniref:cupin domain-containing protein n=1 Tax=Epibacterium ulvae TaxID=1156985 RepID=UPI002491255B|nr:cupin domain-containing protein [Epibacterium ulvae]
MNAQNFTHTQTQPSFILFGAPEVPRTIKDDSANLISGKAEQGVWLYSNDTQSGSKFGIWECNAGRFRATMDGITEFCHILEGEAEVTNLADRSTRIIRAGDSFVMEAGLRTEWYVPVYIKKCFAISDIRP